MLTPRQAFFFFILPSLLSIFLWHYLYDTTPDHLVCWKDRADGGRRLCRPRCPHGAFSLAWMTECRPWLTCRQIQQELKIQKPIGRGAVKAVYLAKFGDEEVAVSYPMTKEYQDDFQHGQLMLRDLSPSQHITQLIGYCRGVTVTEYHKLGTAQNINSVLSREDLQHYNTIEQRFELCINYVQILHYLHNSPLGVRVMCDSNSLEKTLGQYLITDDLHLVANDLDALPEVNRSSGEGIKCGHRQLWGDFVAPEQLWPYEEETFSDSKMPGYDEKTDIWKIPVVCDYLLGQVEGAESLRFHLFKIHNQCKNMDPSSRPDTQEILNEYMRIKDQIGL